MTQKADCASSSEMLVHRLVDLLEAALRNRSLLVTTVVQTRCKFKFARNLGFGDQFQQIFDDPEVESFCAVVFSYGIETQAQSVQWLKCCGLSEQEQEQE